jgi:hypothetical protein
MKPIWNAHVKVQNATEIGTGWGTDDPTGGINAYHTTITLTLPQRAGDVTVTKQADNETVVLNRDASLTCGPNGIEAKATYLVTRRTGNGREVVVGIANNAGQKAPPSGGVLAQATGQVGQNITVRFLIEGTCA